MTSMKRCYRCQQELTLKVPPASGDVCIYCQADLHCCLNCHHYSPSIYQNCLIPTMDRINDKKANNVCPGFRFRDIEPQRSDSPQIAARKRWENLFRDF